MVSTYIKALWLVCGTPPLLVFKGNQRQAFSWVNKKPYQCTKKNLKRLEFFSACNFISGFKNHHSFHKHKRSGGRGASWGEGRKLWVFCWRCFFLFIDAEGCSHNCIILNLMQQVSIRSKCLKDLRLESESLGFWAAKPDTWLDYSRYSCQELGPNLLVVKVYLWTEHIHLLKGLELEMLGSPSCSNAFAKPVKTYLHNEGL